MPLRRQLTSSRTLRLKEDADRVPRLQIEPTGPDCGQRPDNEATTIRQRRGSTTPGRSIRPLWEPGCPRILIGVLNGDLPPETPVLSSHTLHSRAQLCYLVEHGSQGVGAGTLRSPLTPPPGPHPPSISALGAHFVFCPGSEWSRAAVSRADPLCNACESARGRADVGGRER